MPLRSSNICVCRKEVFHHTVYDAALHIKDGNQVVYCVIEPAKSFDPHIHDMDEKNMEQIFLFPVPFESEYVMKLCASIATP